jgi:glycyl-tRNA synthetase
VARHLSATVESPAQEEAIKVPDMEEIVSLCKRRGIIFPSSEIYNGYAGFYDYGPLGAELKKNIKDAWWRHFVTQREDVVGLDSSIIHNPTTWKSSGKFLAGQEHFGTMSI